MTPRNRADSNRHGLRLFDQSIPTVIAGTGSPRTSPVDIPCETATSHAWHHCAFPPRVQSVPDETPPLLDRVLTEDPIQYGVNTPWHVDDVPRTLWFWKIW
jgi:hypothetical protein